VHDYARLKVNGKELEATPGSRIAGCDQFGEARLERSGSGSARDGRRSWGGGGEHHGGGHTWRSWRGRRARRARRQGQAAPAPGAPVVVVPPPRVIVPEARVSAAAGFGVARAVRLVAR